jgi:3-hydroxybutyryl-CoA dehydrogenase
MKKVLVIGEARRVKEFQQLKLKHAEVTYYEYPEGEASDADWDSGDMFEDEVEERPFVVQGDDAEEDEEETILLGAEDEFGKSALPTEDYDVIFDLNLDDEEDGIITYMYNEGQVVFGCAVKQTLASMVSGLGEMECKVFGMNALPTFLHRPKLEISMLHRVDRMILEATLQTLGLEYEVIEDQIGMVAPRVVCMIINEASFVLGEGTASVEAVDQAMKLGTNYPRGPFEWCDQIGVREVVSVLDALHAQTRDGKYKLAPVLRRHRDLDQLFYPLPSFKKEPPSPPF